MKTLLAGILALTACSCAQTVLYRDGKVIARIQSNVKSLHYKDGDTELSGDFDNSTATTAQKAGAQSIITAAGAAVAISGLTSLIP